MKHITILFSMPLGGPGSKDISLVRGISWKIPHLRDIRWWSVFRIGGTGRTLLSKKFLEASNSALKEVFRSFEHLSKVLNRVAWVPLEQTRASCSPLPGHLRPSRR